MRIRTYVVGMVRTNCYFVINEDTNDTIIIDPGDEANVIVSKLEERNLTPVAILLTHGHFDHIMAIPELIDRYNLSVYASEEEKELLQDPIMNRSSALRMDFNITPNIYLRDNEMLKLAGMNIRAIHTPGHTNGGVCYYFTEEKTLFSGDTLFYESIGRTDMAYGHYELLMESIQNKLMPLPEDVRVYPGHGRGTTIEHEKKYNPFLGNRSWL